MSVLDGVADDRSNDLDGLSRSSSVSILTKEEPDDFDLDESDEGEIDDTPPLTSTRDRRSSKSSV